MNIQIVRVGDVTVIAPTDVLDAVVANSIKLTLADLMESRQVRLVVDLVKGRPRRATQGRP